MINTVPSILLFLILYLNKWFASNVVIHLNPRTLMGHAWAAAGMLLSPQSSFLYTITIFLHVLPSYSSLFLYVSFFLHDPRLPSCESPILYFTDSPSFLHAIDWRIFYLLLVYLHLCGNTYFPNLIFFLKIFYTNIFKW